MTVDVHPQQPVLVIMGVSGSGKSTVAGILAGEGAGADVTVITETHATPFETPHFTIANYAAWQPRVAADGKLALSAA